MRRNPLAKSLKIGSFALTFSCAAGAAWAAGSSSCARPTDITALQSVDVQQQLMVSALDCSELERFNAYQTTFHKELLANDNALMSFMRRIKGGTAGTAEYHSYKTRAANDAQLRYIADPVGYCANAKTALDQALNPDSKPLLAVFVSAQPVIESEDYTSCDIELAGNIAASAPRVVPIPVPKPSDDASDAGSAVLPAQGSAMGIGTNSPSSVAAAASASGNQN
jgi:hypothetical protein